MGIYKTYFDKNNTIIRNSSINTGKNPICELSCGDKITRFIFYVDFNYLSELYINKFLDPTDPNILHILKIRNTSNFDINPVLNTNGDIAVGDNFRSTSCDIEIRPITQLWDEGNGYDYEQVLLLGDNNYNVESSNWTGATSLTKFDIPGAINNDVILSTQHLDDGHEDIELDITEFVNSVLTNSVSIDTYTGNTSNYQGFCLKYSDASERAFSGMTKTLGLFTKYTTTFFEPFIETYYDDLIQDDRVNFFLVKDNNLFLYVNINGSLANLDEIPTCKINDNGYEVQQKTKGVYYITIPMEDSVESFLTYNKYNDMWSNLRYNGKILPNKKLSFIPLDSDQYLQIGSNVIEPIKYGISLSGIKFGETITQGEIRRINVLLRKPYTITDYGFVEQLYYRLYVKQGPNLIEVLDWQQINKGYDSNFMFLDTSWMLPQIYYMDIKMNLGGEVTIYNEKLRFTVNSKIIN